MATTKSKGDFGYSNRPYQKEQVVGIFDLVGFTKIDFNDGLVQAVKSMQTAMEVVLTPYFHWGELNRREEESYNNDILLRSTGDGYVVAFSQGKNDSDALRYLTELHKKIKKQHPVNLGINKGSNYIIGDVNQRVNIIGWGINWAARALQYAEKNQIICTSYFADSLIQGDGSMKKVLVEIGERQIKSTKIKLYNYYKNNEFGAPLTKEQKEE